MKALIFSGQHLIITVITVFTLICSCTLVSAWQSEDYPYPWDFFNSTSYEEYDPAGLMYYQSSNDGVGFGSLQKQTTAGSWNRVTQTKYFSSSTSMDIQVRFGGYSSYARTSLYIDDMDTPLYSSTSLQVVTIEDVYLDEGYHTIRLAAYALNDMYTSGIVIYVEDYIINEENLTGYVTNNLGNSVSAATITLNNSGGSTNSNDTGYYEITGISSGTYSITATSPTHEDYSDTVSITADTEKNITMTRLNPVSVSYTHLTLPTILRV